MTKASRVPAGFQTRYFKFVKSETMPEIEVNGTTAYYPVFITEEVKAGNDGETEEEDRKVYHYLRVPVSYHGQPRGYEEFARASYAEIRSYLYGSMEAQSEMRDDSTYEAHRQAVRSAFPRYDGEVNASEERWNAIKAEFHALVAEVCEATGKEREDLPACFTSEEMMEFAVSNGMTAEEIANYSLKFATLSLNALHNNRNWKEFFQ